MRHWTFYELLHAGKEIWRDLWYSCYCGYGHHVLVGGGMLCCAWCVYGVFIVHVQDGVMHAMVT